MSARHRRPARHRTTSRPSSQYATLLRVCRARGCSREDAKDVVQEAHLRLIEYQRSAKLLDPESILRRIVINITTNRYHSELSSPLVSESIDKLDRSGMLVDPAAGPERTLAAEQELDGVARLLSAVSERACQILVAQRAGYSYEEISAAFAIKPRTVEKHVWLATSMLRGD